MAFSNIENSEKLEIIDIAIVNNEEFENNEIFKETFKTLSDDLSIKAMLPKEADSDKISTYIVENYPEYKAHSKKQGEYPIVAIGYRRR